MEKRFIENLGVSTSLLGFGCMRLPQKDGKIDEVLAEKCIDKAYAAAASVSVHQLRLLRCQRRLMA